MLLRLNINPESAIDLDLHRVHVISVGQFAFPYLNFAQLFIPPPDTVLMGINGYLPDLSRLS